MCLVPLTERRGVDLDNSGFSERVGPNEFIVRRVEGHANDADFPRYTFGAPREIAGFKAESAVFGVTTTGADKMDTFGAYAGIGWLAAFLESSVSLSSDW